MRKIILWQVSGALLGLVPDCLHLLIQAAILPSKEYQDTQPLATQWKYAMSKIGTHFLFPEQTAQAD